MWGVMMSFGAPSIMGGGDDVAGEQVSVGWGGISTEVLHEGLDLEELGRCRGFFGGP